MLEKTYNPKDFETAIYEGWEHKEDKYGCTVFQPAMDNPENKGKFTAKDENFCIVIPPANVTGYLHMGHALDYTLQDILVRYNRMLGKNVLWQVGTDHAGIATQMVVERNLAKEGKSRHDFTREAFVDKVWEWKKHSGGTITRQLRRLGASVDWKRERFTMDEGLSKAVRKIFVMMYHDGLIRKNKRLVNWDPKLGTAVSDLEVVSKDVAGKMYYYKYPIEGEDGAFIHIATTRPETMFGDTAVAVSAENEKLKHLIGKNAVLPIVNRPIPIVADEHADPEKGTGAVKITPAHDFNDFEVGKRHNLPMINILNLDGTLNENTPFPGMDTQSARAATLAKLEELGLMEKVEDHPMTIPYGDRSGAVIEPLLTDQWFVDAPELAKDACRAVECGAMSFIPDNYKKTYFEWMGEGKIQPWCISRQLWWGHQIPIWYGPDGTVFCEENEAEAQAKADEKYGKHVELTRETDVLDTWFSSGLWAFSTLGWPDDNPNNPEDYLKHFYPTSVLVTGFDIIFFWVARMMMMSLYVMRKRREAERKAQGLPIENPAEMNKEDQKKYYENLVPFANAYLHGLVRDEQGRKMSKSKGNTVDPLEIIDKYGADALRFFMASMETQGRDVNMSEPRIAGYRNFATKIWNAVRFGEMNECNLYEGFDIEQVKLPVNKWVVNKIKKTVSMLNANLKDFRFSFAAANVYDFIWREFCKWYIELSKPILYGEDEAAKTEVRATFAWARDNILKFMHPFMPFITTELWNKTADRKGEELMTSAWPKLGDANEEDMCEIDRAIDLIEIITSLRGEVNIPAAAQLKAAVVLEGKDTIAHNYDSICRQARLESVTVLEKNLEESEQKGMIMTYERGMTVYLNVEGIIDVAAEKARLEKTLAELDKNLKGYAAKLSNANFVDRAPAAVVAEERRRQAEALEQKEKAEIGLKRLERL